MKRSASAILLVLLFSFGLSATEETVNDVLVVMEVTEPKTVSLLKHLPVSVHYRGDDYIIAGIGVEDSERLEETGIDYEVIDEDAWSEPYYLINRPGERDIGVVPGIGRIVFQNDREAIVKIADKQVLEVARAGFQLLRLFPTALPLIDARAAKPLPMGDRIQSGEVIGAIVNQVSQDILRSSVQRLQDFQTRFFASDSIDAAAQWFFDRFVDFGYTDVIFDNFVDPVYGVPVRNVIATKPGILYPDSVIIIGGHYDSIVYDGSEWFVWAPGADDNASGTVGVLEAARILANVDLDCTVKFACWTAEEVGLFGAWHYAEGAYRRGEKIGLYINYDMLGHLDRSDPVRDISIKRNPSAQTYADVMSDMANQHTTLVPVQYPAGVSSDHVPFMQYGYSILYVEEADFYTYLHTAVDVIDSMDIPYFCEVVKMGLATLTAVAGPPETIPIADPVLAYESYLVDDDDQGSSIGNGNGFFDPGETVQLSLSLQNFGDIQANNVSAQLLTDDSYVTILEDVQTFGDIAPGEIGLSEGQFLFEIDADCPVGRFIDFTVDATMAGDLQWTSYFTVRVEQPSIAYEFFRLEELSGDDDGILDPGETVDLYLLLKNVGLRYATGITAELETEDPGVTITDNQAVFPDMAVESTVENTNDPFTCSLIGDAVPHTIPFVLHISEGEGYYQTDIEFCLCIGQGTVLLVVDDGNADNEEYYIETFQYLGIPYDIVEVEGVARSVSNPMLDYSEVIWYTGPAETNTLMSEDQSDLETFLDSGGRLLLSGSMIGYDVGNTPFYRNYLHGRYVSFMTMLHHLKWSLNPVVGEMDITLASEGANAQGFAGETDPISPAVSIFNYDQEAGEEPFVIKSSGSGALAVETSVYKVVYCSFGLEGVEPLADRAQVLEDVLLWFKEPGIDKGDVDGNGTTNILDALMAVNIVLGLHEPTVDELARADMNYDGGIDVLDVIQVVNAVLGAGGVVKGGVVPLGM